MGETSIYNMHFLKKYKYQLIIIGLFLLQFVFISPIGEFALNDDWVHSEIIKHWVNTGEFRMNPFAGPTFYVPILIGVGISKIFTFSFSALRISTLVLSLATLLLTYQLIAEITKKQKLALFAALIIWLNPIFYNLSFTFMTDIPGLFFIVLSVYLYYRGFVSKKAIWLLFAGLVVVLGTYTRQTNIVAMIAAGIYSLTQLKNIKFKNLLWSYGIPAILGCLIYWFLWKNGFLPDTFTLHEIPGLKKTLINGLWWLWYSFVYIGFFVLPFSISWGIKNLNKIKDKLLLATTLIPIIIAILIRQIKLLQFPYVANIINLNGLGPMQGVLRGEFTSLIPSKILGIITIISAASAGWLIYMILRNKTEKKQELNFVYLFGILFLIPILLFVSFDRYFLPIFFVISILLVAKLQEKEISKIAIGTCLLIFAIFSISQTSFYMNWNKTRWNMAENILFKSDLETYHIDAGYEWNGFQSYWSAQESDKTHGPVGSPWWIRHVFVNNTSDYALSFSPIEGFDVIEQEKIKGWNPNNTLYLLKNKNSIKKQLPDGILD